MVVTIWADPSGFKLSRNVPFDWSRLSFEQSDWSRLSSFEAHVVQYQSNKSARFLDGVKRCFVTEAEIDPRKRMLVTIWADPSRFQVEQDNGSRRTF